MISPTEAYARHFDGVLIEFKVEVGTTRKFLNIGVRNSSLQHPLPELPLVESGCIGKQAFFKLESNPALGLEPQINIGLGNGAALKIFNDNIKTWRVLRP